MCLSDVPKSEKNKQQKSFSLLLCLRCFLQVLATRISLIRHMSIKKKKWQDYFTPVLTCGDLIKHHKHGERHRIHTTTLVEARLFACNQRTFRLVNSNHLTNEFMCWHSDTRDSAQKLMCPALSLSRVCVCVWFPFLWSAVYSERCIIDSFFPSSLVRLLSCPHIITAAKQWLWSRESCSDFDPTWSIFYCLLFNTFLKILPISSHSV